MKKGGRERMKQIEENKEEKGERERMKQIEEEKRRETK